MPCPVQHGPSGPGRGGVRDRRGLRADAAMRGPATRAPGPVPVDDVRVCEPELRPGHPTDPTAQGPGGGAEGQRGGNGRDYAGAIMIYFYLYTDNWIEFG